MRGHQHPAHRTWCHVRSTAGGAPAGARAAGGGAVFGVLLETSHGRYRAWAGQAGRSAPVPATVLDEHLAVDADRCACDRWLACADVLYGSRPRSPAEAVRDLATVLARHRGCRVMAVPLAADGGHGCPGGWMAAVPGGAPLLLRCAPDVPPDPLVVSCLHGWLTTGRELSELSRISRPPARADHPEPQGHPGCPEHPECPDRAGPAVPGPVPRRRRCRR